MDLPRPTTSPTDTHHGITAALGPIVPLLASIVSLCIGTSFAKSLFPVAGPAGMTALRVGLAALMLVAVQRPWRWRIDRAAAFAVIRYGTVLGLMNLCFYSAFQRLPLGIAIAIEFLGPLGVAIVYSARRIDFLWIACAAVGVAWLVLPGSGGTHIDLIGVGFALVAALFWALYIVWGKQASALLPESRIVCLGLCVASVVAVPFGIVEAGAVLLEPRILGAGLAVAVLCSVIPYSCEMIALKRMPRHVFGVMMSLEPAVGALAALLILGEKLSPMQWLAIGAVMVASGGSALSRPPIDQPPLPLP